LAPAVDQELPVLRLVARLGIERLELVLGALERPAAQFPDRAIVGDRTQQRRDMAAQLFDLLAGGLRVAQAVDRLGALVDLLAEVGEGLLELVELLGELVVGRTALVGTTELTRRIENALRHASARRRNQQQQRGRQQSERTFRKRPKNRIHGMNSGKREPHLVW